MLLRQASSLVRSAKYANESKLSLVCSFEPLHFKTYLQAFLVERFPEATPEVLSFGFDQLEIGLKQTSDLLSVFPALVFLSWEDIHPQLTWRTRSSFEIHFSKEILELGIRLKKRLKSWLDTRQGAESYFACLLLSGISISLGSGSTCPMMATFNVFEGILTILYPLSRFLQRMPDLSADKAYPT